MLSRGEIIVSPRGYTHRVFDGGNFTFCSQQFPLDRKGWRRLREDEKITLTCKTCQKGRAGY